MGWTFVRIPRDQLIRELIAPQDSERVRIDVIDHTLAGDVLWTVIRITAKQQGMRNLSAGETACFIGCDLLESSDGQWGYKSLSKPSTLTTTVVRCVIWRWRPSNAPNGDDGCARIAARTAMIQRQREVQHGPRTVVIARRPAALRRRPVVQ